ncbi:MAG: hypothetical protein PHR44_00300 [Candidatus Omnitrophica bacterium]|nr:hypothetical protein [Candidatus Omnitrophota bacterium]
MADKLVWEKGIEDKFRQIINKISLFHRSIAEGSIRESAQLYATERGSALIEEVDVVKAMFMGVPAAFAAPMKKILDAVGIDYAKYGFGK